MRPRGPYRVRLLGGWGGQGQDGHRYAARRRAPGREAQNARVHERCLGVRRHRHRMVDETTPPNPTKLVAWRPAHEQMVLQAPGMRGLVVRPGDVYGGPGGLTGQWFAGPSTGKPPLVVGDGRNRVPMVHVDDLADAYLRVAESGLAGEIFNVNDQSRFTVLEMATAAARAAGYKGEVHPIPLPEARKTLGDFADALALSQHVDARKAVRLLGWQPRHVGFPDEADAYYRAWKAHQD